MANHPLDETFNLSRRSGWSFFTFLTLLGLAFSFLLHFRFKFKMVSAGIPKALKEVVEGTDPWKISRFETAEDGVVGNTFHFIDPFGKAYFRLRHEEEKKRTEHRSWIARLGTFCIIVILKQCGDVRQIGHPELHNELPIIIDNDEDPARIILLKTLKNGLLIRCMRN